MPMLIRTPEQILREERKDLYVIHSTEGEKRPGLAMIREWIRENLPGTRTELLGPSEYSGIAVGGIGDKLRVDFTLEGLKQFCVRWEDEQGGSIDKRFQCYLYPYDSWYQEHGRFIPTADCPQGIGATVWWYTSKGFIYHQLSEEEAKRYDGRHPANERDIWFHVADLWPELAVSSCEEMTYGRIGRPGGKWHVVYVPPAPFAESPLIPTVAQIREWFQLPDDVEIMQGDF